MPRWLALFCFLLAASAAAKAENIAHAMIEDASIVGSGRLTVLFWDVYDATLYAPQGQWQQDRPFALSLHYLLEIDSRDIAERSVEEMRKQGLDDEMKLAAWYSQMQDIFPNVREGTVLTGLYQPEQGTVFYLGNEKIGQINDPEFGRWFFNIWLSERTSEPELRQKLLRL